MTTLRANERAGVRLELLEGKYSVSVGENCLLTTGVRSLAELTYEEELYSRDPMREVRERERSFYEMQALRSESFERRAKSARKTGGKGGRGGV